MLLKLTIEALIYSLVYAIFIVLLMKKQGAIKQLYNYPPAIQKRAIELGITSKEEIASNSKKNKPFGFAVMTVMSLVIICSVNHETTFWAGFYQSYILFNAFSLFDAVVLDIGWFCHGKFWIIPGTEDMTEEYRSCWFHWKWFFLGLVTMIPMAAVIGGLTVLIGMVF